MKKYTQKDFDKFEVVDGIVQCPTGDYSSISVFTKLCSFAKHCSFAKDCFFAKYCSFAEYCSFSERCSFSEYCSFAQGCSFAERCSFAKGIKIEGYHKLIAYIGIDRIGSRLGKTYFFKCKDGLFVRCGCWFGTMEDFTARVKETHPTGRFRKEYDMAIDYATKWAEFNNEKVEPAPEDKLN